MSLRMLGATLQSLMLSDRRCRRDVKSKTREAGSCPVSPVLRETLDLAEIPNIWKCILVGVVREVTTENI